MSAHEFDMTRLDIPRSPADLCDYTDAQLSAIIHSANVLLQNTANLSGRVRLEDGSYIFVKRSNGSEFTREHYGQEIVNNQKLDATGFKEKPALLAFSPATYTAVFEDLGAQADFSDEWNVEKLRAALTAMNRIAELPTEGFEKFTIDNGWKLLGEDKELQRAIRSKLGDNFDTEMLQDIDKRTMTVDVFLAQTGVVSHGDVRGDNFGYNPMTKEGVFVDWSWCGTAPRSKDATELLVSVSASGYNIPDELLHASCTSEACLMLAGYWLSQCTLPAWEGGETVRTRQAATALIAWKWYKQLIEVA